MKRIFSFFLLFLLCHFNVNAQSDWQIPTDNKQANILIDSINTAKVRANPDAAYMEGAVPTGENGEVVFTHIITNSLSSTENYDLLLNHLAELTRQKPSLSESRLLLVNASKHIIVAHFEEWLVFKSSMFELDRTRFVYMLMAECEDNSVKLTINRISYQYEDNSRLGKQTYKAEDWITDSVALTKKKDKLRRQNAKFRRKTIDRINEIFSEISLYTLKQ